MLKNKKAHLKTEVSADEDAQSNSQDKKWILFSNQRKKRLSNTPLRFAEIKMRNKVESKENPSTRDRDSISKEGTCKSRPVQNEIVEAINVIRQIGSKGNGQSGKAEEAVRQVTPFVLNGEESFQEEVSFKGVANKASLLQQVQRIEREANRIINQILSIKQSFRSMLTHKTNENIRTKKHAIDSSFEIVAYTKAFVEEVDQLRVELGRCRTIMRVTTGIADRSLEFYKCRFARVLAGFSQKIECLLKYFQESKGQLQNGAGPKTREASRFNGC